MRRNHKKGGPVVRAVHPLKSSVCRTEQLVGTKSSCVRRFLFDRREARMAETFPVNSIARISGARHDENASGGRPRIDPPPDGWSHSRSSPAAARRRWARAWSATRYVLPPASVQELFQARQEHHHARSAQSRRRPFPHPEVPGADRSQADVAADAAAGDAGVRAGGEPRMAARDLWQRRRSASTR